MSLSREVHDMVKYTFEDKVENGTAVSYTYTVHQSSQSGCRRRKDKPNLGP